jgi:hypothetical protein
MGNYAERPQVRGEQEEAKSTRSGRFIATFAVRHQIADPVIAENIHNSIDVAIKKHVSKGNIPRRLAKNCMVVRPDKMGITVIERKRFREGMLAGVEEQEDVELPHLDQVVKLAHMLSQRLTQLAPATDVINFRVGQVQPFGRGELKRSLAAIPEGWRERKLHYPMEDKLGIRTPISLMKDVQNECVDAIAETIPIGQEFSDFTRRNVPHLTVLHNPNGFRRHERKLLAPIIAAVMPEVVPIEQAATVFLPSRHGFSRSSEIKVRPEAEQTPPTESAPNQPFFDLSDLPPLEFEAA